MGTRVIDSFDMKFLSQSVGRLRWIQSQRGVGLLEALAATVIVISVIATLSLTVPKMYKAITSGKQNTETRLMMTSALGAMKSNPRAIRPTADADAGTGCVDNPDGTYPFDPTTVQNIILHGVPYKI